METDLKNWSDVIFDEQVPTNTACFTLDLNMYFLPERSAGVSESFYTNKRLTVFLGQWGLHQMKEFVTYLVAHEQSTARTEFAHVWSRAYNSDGTIDLNIYKSVKETK